MQYFTKINYHFGIKNQQAWTELKRIKSIKPFYINQSIALFRSQFMNIGTATYIMMWREKLGRPRGKEAPPYSQASGCAEEVHHVVNLHVVEVIDSEKAFKSFLLHFLI